MRNLALMWVLAGVAVALLAAGDGKPPVSTFTDKRDGKVYKIVKIGRQVWFAENLNYAAGGSKCYGEGGKVVIDIDENGNAITTTTLSNVEVQAYCAKYGRLYNWETALTACPAGTHLPTDAEWTALVDYVGGKKQAGTKLKSSTGWNSDKEVPAGTNAYGFSALPGGIGYYSGGEFFDAGKYGGWWSATELAAYDAWDRSMYYFDEFVGRGNDIKTGLFSVRCVLYDEKERK